MAFAAIDDPGEFRRRAASLLVDESRHNLILGLSGTLMTAPERYDDFNLFVVSDEQRAIAAALITPPHNLILADALGKEAVDELISGLLEHGVSIPGAIGNRPTIEWFVARWSERSGARMRSSMEQGVFALTEVADLGTAAGEARLAEGGDFELIQGWMRDFVAEAIPDEPYDEAEIAEMIRRRLSGDTLSSYWLWTVQGRPTSWSGHGGPTGRGIRIGPVYTPPQDRGNGYATSLVAHQSKWLLENGYGLCFLYTDLANPTSNRIYERIGYRQVAESAVYLVD